MSVPVKRLLPAGGGRCAVCRVFHFFDNYSIAFGHMEIQEKYRYFKRVNH
jgi:hypothetical protein